MARARNLKPTFFKNDVLCDMPPLTRLLFAGLWTVADREGRLEDRPKRIKADILPYDDCDVGQMLNDLHHANFIVRYTVEYFNYIQILNFKKHQNPHQKEASSEIPAPDLSGASTVQEQNKPCLNLNPESPLPESLTQREARATVHPVEANMLFQRVWDAYPGRGKYGLTGGGFKGSRKKAFEKFQTLLKTEKDHEQFTKELTAGAYVYTDFLDNTGTPSKHLITWLTGECWKDDFSSSDGPARGGLQTNAQALAEGVRRTMRHDGPEGGDIGGSGLPAISTDE